MPLLERSTQLRALHGYAGEAALGNGRLVLVAGEAGVGKSSLVEELEIELAQDPGEGSRAVQWASGSCDGLFTPRPLGPLVDIAGQLGGELEALCQAGAPRDDLFSALLSRAREPGPMLVLVVEDVHWADEASLDMLRFLGRRLRDLRLLLLVTYRDDGLAADDSLRIALGELATQRTTRRVELPTLTANAVASLAQGSGLATDELLRLTGGNPFYLNEILRHGAGELPTSARDAVLAHVARLSDPARRVVEAAALIGSRVEPRLLLAATQASSSTLDELVERGILVEDGARLRFRHEIARLAVEQSTAAHRRTSVHRAVLDALLAEGCDDDAQLAFHAEGAGDAERVLRHAPAAARRARELDSHREALAQFERALRHASGLAPRERAGLYDDLATEASLVDRWSEAAAARQSALTLWRELGERSREGVTLLWLSRALWRLCRGAQAHRAVDEAIAVLEPLGPSPELAWGYAHLADTRMTETRSREALEIATRAQRLAEQLGLPRVLSDALNTAGCALADLGEPWQEPLEQALDVALRGGLQQEAGRAYANLYALHCTWLTLPDGDRYFHEGVAYCDEHDIATFGTCLRGQRALALARSASWDDALRLGRSLLARAGLPSVNRLNPLLSLGTVLARTGRPGAWAHLDEVADLADGLDEPVWIVLARTARAEARWLEGDGEAAAAEIALAERRADGLDPLARGDVALWRRRISGSTEVGFVPHGPHAAQLAGDAPGAATAWDDLGCPYDAALARLDAGDEASVRSALAGFDELGAEPAARLARRALRRLGARSVPAGARASTREHPAGLTLREREVLELICAGATNEQISKRLVISVKTVDHHVSAVLAKLDVGSRREVAEAAARLGIDVRQHGEPIAEPG
ncbi:AAA family ATPase [Angustibacter sp. McL0619]|uniref:AAA family ATPase n=1 Tax=Angustibacter sp. McL0619 TaxID=3415676 RepID=UPI003CF5CD46